MKLCNSETEFLAAVAPAAQSACARLGTFLPSCLIAQAAQETGYCISSYADNPQLAILIEKNNLLGVKSALLTSSWADKSLWNGVSITKSTPEYYNGKKVTIQDEFRVYESVEQCFMDYILFLLYASNYGKGGKTKYGREVTDIKDPAKLITTVAGRGYATDPSYATSIQNIIKKHNLTKYDNVNYKVEEPMGNIKKLTPPKFIDNRAASKSQIKNWRNKSDKKYIVVHYLGVCGQNQNLWNGGYGATFTIFWNGDVYYTADYTAVTWQCGGKIQGESKDGNGVAPHRFYGKCTNYNSVSIENCVKRTDGKYEGGNDDKWYFTEETQESLVWAVSKMMDDLNIPINRVVRHFDVTGKCCPNPYVRNNGQNGNWTWDEFINNLKQYRKDGTITIPDRSKNPVTPSSGGSGGSSTRNYLMKGDKGSAVKTMQTMLLALNYDLGGYGADGDFGSATESALKAFQKDHSLEVDGIYGKNSKAALEAAYKNLAATIKRGDKGDSVKKMQEMLIACKCLDEGEADGDFGPRTEAAVKMAQYILLGDGKQTGIYDATTKAAVEKCYAKVTDKRFIFKDTNFAFVFDPVYYLNKYADLKKAYGTDKQKAFDHFVKHGMNEKRQGSADFNVEVYAKNYPELVEHYKGDWFMLYRHYCKHGLWESRRGI